MSQRTLRILHIANDVTGKGNGIVNAMVDIACFQRLQGHSVAIGSAGGEHETLLQKCGVVHFQLDQTRRPIALIRAIACYRRILKDFDPDIVHCHMMTGMLLAWFCRGFGRYRLVSHIQNVHQRSSVLMGLGERVIPVASAVADYMASRGLSRSRMRVVGNFTLGSLRVPPMSQIPPVPLTQPSIVTVGGMYRRKGIAELISAFAGLAGKFPEAHLYLVGDGPDRATFEKQAASLPCAGRIHFEGFQPTPQAYMKAATIFVLASHRESFGIVLGEAREAGCAIVASDVDGIPEALDHGRAGILIPPGDIGALRNTLTDLLADEGLRTRWSRAAGEGLERFTAHAMAAQVTSVYGELLDTGLADRPEKLPAHSAQISVNDR
jgi:glycosyltransferase involved in cell wall biosynthesis